MLNPVHVQDDILEYYRRELSYLRTQSADFAMRYPKVAERLALNGAESTDPHTERLIESVAFLTARVHRDIDREFPNVALALLENVCPNLTQPIPAMTVMQLKLDSSQGKVTSGMSVPRGTMLSTTAFSGENCRFQVAWDTTLWPVHINSAKLEDARTLRLNVLADPVTDIGELEINNLRLHISGELLTTMPLHELLIHGLERLEIIQEDGAVHRLSLKQIREFGFEENEEILPLPAHAHPAYALLQEYFCFPRKFQFFELTGLQGLLGRGSAFSIRFIFNRNAQVLSLLSADNFLLGCTPAINLFPLTSEPIVLDNQQYEYHLVPDFQRDAITEVHSVLSVTASNPGNDQPVLIPSVFAPFDESDKENQLHWSTRREMSMRKGISGTDTFISFMNKANVDQLAQQPVLYANLLCTNRQLASQITPGTRFYGSGISASTQIHSLYQPSLPKLPVMSSKALWAMVSLLRLNYRSLVEGSNGVDSLRNMLLLFAGDSAHDQAQIRGIKSLTANPITARLGQETWRGYCSGTQITLEFDTEAFVGSSPLVLAGVLSRFFSLYTSANSFIKLSVKRDSETWMQWPARSGRQCLL